MTTTNNEFKLENMRIAKDSTKDISDNIVITINFTRSVPIVYLDQTRGAGPVKANTRDAGTMRYNLGVKNRPLHMVADSVKGYLVDPDDPGRFQHKAHIASITTNNIMHIYWDSKEKNVFIIPELTQFAQHEMYHNKMIEIEGVQLRNAPLGGMDVGLTGPVVPNAIFPEPNEIDTTSSHLIMLPGLAHHSPFNNYTFGFDLDGDPRGLEGSLRVPVEFHSLGNFFNSEPVFVTSIVPNGTSGSVLEDGGKFDIPDILIPLCF